MYACMRGDTGYYGIVVGMLYYLGCFDFAIHRTRFVIFDGVLFDEIKKLKKYLEKKFKFRQFGDVNAHI